MIGPHRNHGVSSRMRHIIDHSHLEMAGMNTVLPIEQSVLIKVVRLMSCGRVVRIIQSIGTKDISS